MARITKSREERRQEIIEVSARLFLSQGYEQTSISDIVREVKVAQGTFYYHFNSKSDVLEAVALSVLPEIEKALIDIVNKKDDTPTQILAAFTERLLLMQTEHESILDILHRKENIILHETTMDRLVGIVSPLLRAILIQGWSTGEFRELPHQELAMDALLTAIISMAHHPDFSAGGIDGPSARTAEVFIERVLGIEPGKFKLGK